MSDRKRGFEGNGETSTAKRLKSDATTPNGSSPSPAATADLIAQKRAEIAAKIAAMKKSAPVSSASASLSTSAVASPSPVGTPLAASTPQSASPAPADDLARRVAEAKRRVAEAQSKLAVKDNPYMSMPQAGKKKQPVEPAQQGAGLKMAAHPLLLDSTPVFQQSKKDRYKPMQPKFASIKANARNAPTPPPAPTPTIPIESKANPYASGSATPDSGFEGAPKERVGRQFRFNPKGKYVQLGNQIRQEAQLEQLKQRIAESARKAGLDSEFETLEKNIRREPPPDAEWWDAALLPNKSYDDLAHGIEHMNIRNNGSPITMYIQHPIPIPAPADKNKATLKPLKLTKKARSDLHALHAHTDNLNCYLYCRSKRSCASNAVKPNYKTRGIGSVWVSSPLTPLKVRQSFELEFTFSNLHAVRLANLMKVLTSDAVQDPTRVEARVRREVAMRKHQHEKMNAERKLNDDQRREKIENKKVEEEKKGIYGAVFKIKTLSDPAHRFKVRKNAEQMNLTGVCIFNPTFSMSE
ncbi:hypothetical protein NM688_g5425 [Phlebia brevispora]|uniref:Uncharacterized protein n=1 Tax=Phlebia brevispora TaxID=194682 RepID=A0ACC1SV93_9APHY|nr:hypothetical protein NM688_g5425 [Phlebia brevispora]